MLKKLLNTLIGVLVIGFILWCGGYTYPSFFSAIELKNPFTVAIPTISTPVVTGMASSDTISTDWNENEAPEYYKVLGKAKIDDTEVLGHALEDGEIVYQNLDSLGRAQYVYAKLNYADRQDGKEARGDIEGIKPTGWETDGKSNNEKVTVNLSNGKKYKGYFYNRSHLLASSLNGDDSVVNMITGTRMQNVGSNDSKGGGMGYSEKIARDYLDNNPNETLYYIVHPIYKDNELVARAVRVDMKSSDGSIDAEIEVYNAQKGYSINYSTGEFTKD